jgi:hypothetical protein
MCNRPRCVEFVAQHPERGRIGRQLRTQRFERYEFELAVVERAVNFAHASRTQKANDFEAPVQECAFVERTLITRAPLGHPAGAMQVDKQTRLFE